MANRKGGGLINRILMGSEKSEGYARATMPSNRWELFWDIFKGRFWKLVLINVLMLLFLLPLIGLFVLRYMRQKKEFNNVPVIMLTGNKEKATVVSCIQSGAQGYLTKPINAMSLILRVRQLLGVVPKEVFDEAEADA